MNQTIVVNHALIARVQEPVGVKRVPRRLFIIQVSHDNLGAPRQYFAGLPHAQLLSVLVQNLDICAGDNRPDGLRVLVVVECWRVRRDAAAGLSHAVALFEPGLREALLEQLQDLLGQRCGAGREALDARQVVVVDDRVAHQTDQDRWDEEQLFDLVLDHRLQHRRHREGGEHDDLGVDHDRQVQTVHETGDVEERQHGEHLFVAFRRDLLHLEALSDDVLMCDHDGFGQARSAGADGGHESANGQRDIRPDRPA